MKRKLLIIITIVATTCMALTFASCGADQGQLIAVTEPTYPPFDTTDEKGNIVGFDMDLLSAIAEDQGFKIEYQATNFDSLIPAVISGSADVIAAGVNANDPNRQKKLDFSDTYYDSGLVVMVKKTNDEIKGIDSLKPTMKVASQTGTTGAEKALELKDEDRIRDATILDEFNACVQQLLNGDVDAVIIDKAVADNYAKTKTSDVKLVGEVLNAESYGFAVKKGNIELRDKINLGLSHVKENGIYDKIYDKWFK